MSRALDDLSSPFRPVAIEAIARLIERGLAVMIVDTLRTLAEHQVNLAKGTSRIVVSRHLPRKIRGFPVTDPDAECSDAIDLAPYKTFTLHGSNKLQWDADDPAWKVIGEVAESVGALWGGHWRAPRDPGHLELKRAWPDAISF